MAEGDQRPCTGAVASAQVQAHGQAARADRQTGGPPPPPKNPPGLGEAGPRAESVPASRGQQGQRHCHRPDWGCEAQPQVLQAGPGRRPVVAGQLPPAGAGGESVVASPPSASVALSEDTARESRYQKVGLELPPTAEGTERRRRHRAAHAGRGAGRGQDPAWPLVVSFLPAQGRQALAQG